MLRTAVYGDDQRMDLLGSRGMIIADNRKPHVVKRFAVKTVKASEPYQIAFHERYNEAFMAGIDGIVDCVEKAATPLACFEDGRRALYAIGGNEDAARAAGINVDRVTGRPLYSRPCSPDWRAS